MNVSFITSSVKKVFFYFDVTCMLNCFKLFLREYVYHLKKSLMIALTDFSVFCTTIVCESVVALGVSAICWCVSNLLVFLSVDSCRTNNLPFGVDLGQF